MPIMFRRLQRANISDMYQPKFALGLASSLSITGADAQSGSNVEMAEWSKAMRLGRIPKGRGFKSHSRHFVEATPRDNSLCD